MAKKYDFSGYATRNDILCADGRTIRKDAFKDCDGAIVPLVWQHSHGDAKDVLGHCVLENRSDGVYTYGSFNETEAGKTAKELVRHGDIRALSIYANQLVQKGADVLHGMIREVSLCLAGANPGAMIEDLSFEHFDDEGAQFEARIYNGDNIELYHSEDKAEETTDEAETAQEEKTPETNAELSHSEDKKENNKEEIKMADSKEKTVKDVWDGLTDEEKNVVYYMIGQALEQAGVSDKKEDEEDDEKMMKHAYTGSVAYDAELAHSAFIKTIETAKKRGQSLREVWNDMVESSDELMHAIDTTGMTVPPTSNADYASNVGYGINDPSFLYPEARNLNPTPEFIGRNMDWVQKVWNGVTRTPFARVKSVFANITEDEARAKGYIKGNMKREEFFSLMKRVTVPQTVYKKQKIDRDDVIDITDFDVVRWLRGEMRMMWDEETARAFLIGDGRSGVDADKISEEHIRPIAAEDPIFAVQVTVDRGANDDANAKNFMRAAVKERKKYRGSGNPTLFTTEDMLTSMLLLEDGLGHRIYKSESELATALRVSDIVTVQVMEGHTLANGNELLGIIVNLKDYTVGTDKGGEVNLFDDFDIDFNQYKYLIEARCSGCLTKPYSAMVLSMAAAEDTEDPEDPEEP